MHPGPTDLFIVSQIFSSARFRRASPKQRFLSPKRFDMCFCRQTFPSLITKRHQTTIVAFLPWLLLFKCELVGEEPASPDHSLSVLPIRCDKIATFCIDRALQRTPNERYMEAIRKLPREPLTHADQPVRAVARALRGKQCCHRQKIGSACSLHTRRPLNELSQKLTKVV
jgi:hypothetical protein